MSLYAEYCLKTLQLIIMKAVRCMIIQLNIRYLCLILSCSSKFKVAFQFEKEGVVRERPVACAGFILAGAEKKFRGGRKKIRGGRIAPEGREKFFCPPCFCFCPPQQNSILPRGQNRQEGGQKTFVYQKH